MTFDGGTQNRGRRLLQLKREGAKVFHLSHNFGILIVGEEQYKIVIVIYF